MADHTSKTDLLTPVEAGIVAGVPAKAVYKAIRERLPKATVVRRKGKPHLTKAAVVCVRLDRELPPDVPIGVRRAVYRQIGAAPTRRLRYGTGVLSYVVDVPRVARAVLTDLARYRSAMALIVEDPEIQGGAAVFRGTRILVRQIADLIGEGASDEELREDYPRLTRRMLAAAHLFAAARPRRGRPRVPVWRRGAPLGERVVARSGA
jgi:uncharacterized protein (DUF433 family)